MALNKLRKWGKVIYPIYELTLHKSYYERGFFNLGVSVEKYVQPESGEVKIILGQSKRVLLGRIDRESNRNGTPRIHGGLELRNWFFGNFSIKEKVKITILSYNEISID